MAKIYAPNKQYTGVSAGVTFAGGAAECEDVARLNWFREHGYRVEEPEKAPVEPAVDPKAGAKDGGNGK